MLSTPPYPPATIPPSDYYTPTPLPTLHGVGQPLAMTGTDVLPGLAVAAVLVAVAIVALLITNHRKARA